MKSEGEVCGDCPTWAWEEQPEGAYSRARHEANDLPGDLAGHPWRGLLLVPVAARRVCTCDADKYRGYHLDNCAAFAATVWPGTVAQTI